MGNRTVAVGDDLSLPASIKVVDANLPARLASAVVAVNWTPTTAYVAGQPVVNPTGDVVTAKTTHTSGASFTAANWNLSTSYVPMDATGKVGIGGAADSTAPFKVTGRAIVGAGTEAGDAVNKGQCDAATIRYAPAGALAITMDRRMIASTANPALTSGTLRLTALWLPKGTVVTSLTYLCGVAVTGLTNRWFSLFDASRVLLRTTADNTGTWNAGSPLTIPLASTYSVPADGLYYVGICEVATTPTQLRGVASTTSSGMAIAPILNGDSTASLTNAASTPSTAAAITANGNIPFAYVS